MLTADCMWISVEMSPVSVTRKLPVTDSTTLPGEADGTDGADTEATSRQVTIVRTLAAHLENNIVVLSLHTHFHLAGSSKLLLTYLYLIYILFISYFYSYCWLISVIRLGTDICKCNRTSRGNHCRSPWHVF